MSFGGGPLAGQGILKHSDQRILLIEDSRMFSTALTFGLQTTYGLHVTHCATLKDLEAELQGGEGGFALAVLDLNLPDAPNCQALDLVVAHGIPAIVFTAAFNDRTRDEVMKRDVVGCIIKHQPESIQQVIVLVDRVLTSVGTTVLLAMPDRWERDALAGHLRRQRFRVVEALTGDEVSSMLASGTSVDIVVVDMALGDTGGAALLTRIRRQASEEQVAVIGLGTDPAEAAGFFDRGGNEFLAKPLSMPEFERRLFQVAKIHARVRALHRVAARDYLTDLFNRRYFFETGPRLVERSLSRNLSTCIAIFDIDHFKRLNDTYGHEVGDLVLKAVARRLRSFVGEEHLLARLGGEEFGILFNGLSIEDAGYFCDALRLEIAKTRVLADDEEISITISIGLALIAARESFDNYLNAADQFLYMAKSAGRNCVMSESKMMLLAAS
ncbi:GGDEF domain-containing protein [Ensifer soli]|uniref:GGDEF domain-containing protein n=1 Tax=Ciceribacter sp. sgz301302 TaxID=3342379 RepID=UPI0035B84C06